MMIEYIASVYGASLKNFCTVCVKVTKGYQPIFTEIYSHSFNIFYNTNCYLQDLFY